MKKLETILGDILTFILIIIACYYYGHQMYQKGLDVAISHQIDQYCLDGTK